MENLEPWICLRCGVDIEYKPNRHYEANPERYLANRRKELWKFLRPERYSGYGYCREYCDLTDVARRSCLCEDCGSIIDYLEEQFTEIKRVWWKTRNDQNKPAVDFDTLRRQAYETWLQSEYWSEVRKLIHRRANSKCEQCGGDTELEVHHKTYEHHGIEHLYLQDLILLCGDCHESKHR